MSHCRPKQSALARIFIYFVTGLVLFLTMEGISYPATMESTIATKSEITFVFDGNTYKALLYIPQDNNSKKSYPFLIATPGVGERLLGFIRSTDLARMASLHGFIVAFPQIEQNNNWIDWLNRQNGDNYAAGFFRSLIVSASKSANIQSNNIYLTGFSTGGMLVLTAMCDLANDIAAFAVVSASLPNGWKSQCSIKRAVPAIIMASRTDPVMPWDGGQFTVPLAAAHTFTVLPIDETVALWRSNNKCNPRPVLEPLANADVSDGTTVTRLKYDYECRNDAQVLLYAITGGGHSWPGSVIKLRTFQGNISQDISASNTIWEFMRKYSLKH